MPSSSTNPEDSRGKGRESVKRIHSVHAPPPHKIKASTKKGRREDSPRRHQNLPHITPRGLVNDIARVLEVDDMELVELDVGDKAEVIEEALADGGAIVRNVEGGHRYCCCWGLEVSGEDLVVVGW